MRHIAILALLLPLTACLTPGEQPSSKDWNTAHACLWDFAHEDTWARPELMRCMQIGRPSEPEYAPGTKNPAMLAAIMNLYDGNPDLRKCLFTLPDDGWFSLEDAFWYC